ncbi:dTDP-4-dehydrorhamnose 3 5-epimerase [Paramagnetospirillum magnetotacticum MS-1]|uniref:dTDP-4-dehydrorhamnose 3,5-epimerase n=1 Tax=Paramagnetospirillum magnetotacticum MS-1 TaxID=272627 RepID=A0A0C2YDG9_PARME|nr:dTDP-4-dehydrorhamnose 3,5-epimerase family protein [Paramagnetospirillum magnetotacticum]KIL97759.1 dTDP-4-dehydrorhamnose 3 5-epimerase [Paramagnetospirillum magnetotacticum MS-1]
MRITERAIKGIFDVELDPAADHRGWLIKPFDARPFAAAGLTAEWRQVIVQFTEHKNTLKGLHHQAEPFLEAKLIAPIEGRCFWVSVDLRHESPTFGQWGGAVLDADKRNSLYVSRGFAHGCLTLSDHVNLLICADNDYSPDHGVSIAWNDPTFAIDWPLLADTEVVMKAEHRDAPPFAAVRGKLGL